ncbi:uncharacterized protein LOC135491100 [Lineus longissimus]|uniref:uncharacterized protein LOC135491100 n=1 Tax=Lineus longissimus TaxID=88925 RepID=UPI00315D35CC
METIKPPKFIPQGLNLIAEWKSLAGGKESWECELRRKYLCKAKLQLQGERVVGRTNDHTHAGNAAKCEAQAVVANIRNRARTTEETPQQIITRATGGISDAGAAALPRVADIRRGVRRVRQEAGNPLPLPENAAAVEIPRHYQLTSDNNQFLQFDSGVGDWNRILLFASGNGLDMLHNSPHWAADGTFKTVPEIFFQLYTVHAFAGNGQLFPCVYGLLTNKRQETYEQMVMQLGELGGNPTEVLMDYERAAKNAFEHVFPETEVKGCFFHLAQNVYRQVQASGLAAEYQHNPQFALAIRMIPALAFVPEEDVV